MADTEEDNVFMKFVNGIVWLLTQNCTHPGRFFTRFFKTKSLEEMELSNIASSTRVRMEVTQLNAWYTFFLVCGHMIGAGIFVLLGTATKNEAGPSILFSILLASVLVFLSALTFCELCTRYPVSGGAFNYTSAIFGEYVSWLTMTVLAASTVSSGGALARNWSLQCARLAGKQSFKYGFGSLDLDPVALGITLVILSAVAFSTKLVTWTNIALKSILFVIIVILLVVAMPEGKPENFDPFMPYGADGVFSGTAAVFFAFTGYDAACYMAEETNNPAKVVPAGTLSAVGFVTTLYFVMTLALVSGVKYEHIDSATPFYSLLQGEGHHWAAVLVTAGAMIAIATVLMISLLVSTRQLLAMARYHLLPSWLASINYKWKTPIRLVFVFGGIKALLALTSSAQQLAKYRSAGTLVVVIIVAASFMWSRVINPEESSWSSKVRAGISLCTLIGLAMVFGVLYEQKKVENFTLAIVFVAFLSVALLCVIILPEVTVLSEGLQVPMPILVGSGVIFGASFFLLQLGTAVVVNIGYFLAGSSVLYYFYGVHAAQWHDQEVESYIRQKLVNGEFPYENTAYPLSKEERDKLDEIVERKKAQIRREEEGEQEDAHIL